MGAPGDDALEIKTDGKLTDQVTTPTVAETADEVAPAAPLDENNGHEDAGQTQFDSSTPVQE